MQSMDGSQVYNLNPINWDLIGQPAKFIVFLQTIYIFSLVGALMLLLSDMHVLSMLGQPCSWGSTFLTILFSTCISTPGSCLKLHTVPLQPSKSMFYIVWMCSMHVIWTYIFHVIIRGPTSVSCVASLPFTDPLMWPQSVHRIHTLESRRKQ